ncbi:hypothetical protein KZX37_13690 [Microbacterium sp. EYE_5]|uniref:hypothetical protein n=1 Tax=unclassified Microbacterium TaxID=2609290 RepID=UPI0020046EBE|nr:MULTISPECIES: hypothetical protein [unclassified Microbacterium]MCK6080441.1 hypothetical protein [Microbacterium sp. EYE_382]MCK6085712.1 hypothetical protein [Microbacterium sp. EYE_384]MCK6124790.1 hypothetical protein [Microbacterium sp. EYE_80]MCK6127699.1 hypothetical protein [Microbacterium sp. EYE_79]MCK6141396.1 hypothetical protein [Microbacterium sp. EYE_39]
MSAPAVASAASAVADPSVVGSAAPRLRPVEQIGGRLRAMSQARPRRRPRLVFGLVAVAGALTIAGVQMGLSILTTQGAYEVRDLTSQQRDATWQKEILEEDVAGLSSPQFLAANAAALGLVAGGEPSYLRLSDGKTLGPQDGASDASSVQALKLAAVPNALVADVPLVTDPEASLDAGVSIDQDLLVNTPTPPSIADGLPTPATH